MKNKAIKFGVVASLLPHLFCCVLPMVLSIISVFFPEISHTSFVINIEEFYLFAFSGLVLLLSWVLVLHQCPCHQNEKEHGHSLQKTILGLSTLFFIVSATIHILFHIF